MNHINLFNSNSLYELYKNSSDYVLPNVSFITSEKHIKYEPKKTYLLRATYNATPDNLVAFTDATNIKSLKVNSTSIKIEPIKNEITTFDVLGENISIINTETREATFPESYLIKSPISNWSFKAKDPNYTISENTYICMLEIYDGMATISPAPFEEVIGDTFTTNDGVTLDVVDEFLNYVNEEIPLGMLVGFVLADVNNNTLVFIDTEHQTGVTTGGLSTYSFDSEGLYDVEIELVDSDAKNIQFNEAPLISIEIGDNITSIGANAFNECSSLTSIVIGNSLTTIGDHAFCDCTNLTSVIIGDGVTTIGNSAFEDCISMININIPDSVTSIGDHAFYGCSGLTIVTIPDNVTEIGYGAFWDCTNLASVDIPNNVTTIEDYTFYNCTSLTSITIPTSVTSIGSNAFYNCTGKLIVNCNIPEASSYQDAAFYNSKFTQVTIGNNVTVIGSRAFYNCADLTSVTISDSVTSIGSNAFYGCSSLTSIIIPNSVTTIGESAFYNCTGELIINSEIIKNNYTDNNYPSKYGWLSGVKFTKLTIGNSVTSIGEGVFRGCNTLTSVNIPDSITMIGYVAFLGCNSLTSVYISNIAAWCNIIFALYSNPLHLNCNLYLNNELVTDLIIPYSVKTISSRAFEGCSSLTSVNIPDSVTAIRSNAFLSCKNLTSVTIPNSITTISTNTFLGCSSLTSVNIPDSVTKIEGGAFSRCENLTSIIIPDSVTEIGNLAFLGSNLSDITIPNSVTTIGLSAFSSCKNLTSVIIPNSMTEISNYAFAYCDGLNSITCYASTAPSIQSTTFRQVSNGGTLLIPTGSDYSAWMDTNNYYLGSQNWTIQYI